MRKLHMLAHHSQIAEQLIMILKKHTERNEVQKDSRLLVRNYARQKRMTWDL